MPAAAAWYGLAYGNGLFVALSTSTTAASSTDGITWALRTMVSTGSWFNATYGNNVFVAINGAASGTTSAYSTDGITWTTSTLPVASTWLGLTYGTGLFIASTNLSTSATTAASSTDGITWTLRTLNGIAGSGGGLASMPSYSFNISNYIGTSVQPITATTYTVLATDKFLVFNTTAACTVTLPNPGLYPGREIFMKQIAAFAVSSASSNVQPLTSTTAGTAILSGAGTFAKLYSNGQAWVIIG